MRIPCTHQAPQSCGQCDGTEREHVHLASWWLRNKARLPEGYQPRPVDLPPAPREDHA
jgi:hypothetical protein